MPATVTNRFHRSAPSFNMTPVIDMVFLLIIFFSLVLQFIEAENFPVAIPDKCLFAENNVEPEAQITTVTVMKHDGEMVDFAVGSEKILMSGFDRPDLVKRLSGLIETNLADLPPDRRTVTLRIDKEVCFADAQYALAAIAASSATNIQMAVLRDKSP